MAEGIHSEILKRSTGCWNPCTFCERVRKDKAYRTKWTYTLCVYLSFFTLGWLKGQFGPALPDLVLIADVDIQSSSWIFTTFFIAYGIGALSSGWLPSRLNLSLMVSVCFLLLSSALALIPWFSVFGLMLAAFFVKGTIEGIVDPSLQVKLLKIWKQKGRKYLFGLNVVFSMSSILSPLVLAPFLSHSYDNETISTYNRKITNAPFILDVSASTPASADGGQYNMTDALILFHVNVNKSTFVDGGQNMTDREWLNATDILTRPNVVTTKAENSLAHQHGPHGSQLFIPFSISSFLALCVSFIFFILYKSRKRSEQRNTQERENTSRILPVYVKISAFCVLGSFVFLSNGIEEGFIGYLSTFTVMHIGWTKTRGAMLTSVFFFFVLGGRLSSLVFGKCLSTLQYLVISCIVVSMAFIGFLFSVKYNFEIGIWISVSVYGFGTSLLFALVLCWFNEYFFPLSNKISSFCYIIGFSGSAINPQLIGYIIKSFSTISFCYVFVIESILLNLIAIIGAFFTTLVVKKYGQVFRPKNMNVDVTHMFLES